MDKYPTYRTFDQAINDAVKESEVVKKELDSFIADMSSLTKDQIANRVSTLYHLSHDFTYSIFTMHLHADGTAILCPTQEDASQLFNELLMKDEEEKKKNAQVV